MDVSEWQFVTQEELRSTSWAVECPQFYSGTRDLKLGIAYDYVPFQYLSINLRDTLPKSGISKSKEYDSTWTARKKILKGKKDFYLMMTKEVRASLR